MLAAVVGDGSQQTPSATHKALLLGAAGGAALALGALHLIHFKGIVGLCTPSAGKGAGEDMEDRSTTSSVGGGAAAYETRKAVDEYLQFHYGRDEDLLPYTAGPKASVLVCWVRTSMCECGLVWVLVRGQEGWGGTACRIETGFTGILWTLRSMPLRNVVMEEVRPLGVLLT
jgi:hypothetical protein